MAALVTREELAADIRCKLDGCDRPLLARGWCRLHYDRWHRHGTVALRPMEWIASMLRSEPTDECIEWPFSRFQAGYGRVAERHATHVVLEEAGQPRPPAPGDRALHAACAAGVPRSVVAGEFGISVDRVRRIAVGETWADVEVAS